MASTTAGEHSDHEFVNSLPAQQKILCADLGVIQILALKMNQIGEMTDVGHNIKLNAAAYGTFATRVYCSFPSVDKLRQELGTHNSRSKVTHFRNCYSTIFVVSSLLQECSSYLMIALAFLVCSFSRGSVSLSACHGVGQ